MVQNKNKVALSLIFINFLIFTPILVGPRMYSKHSLENKEANLNPANLKHPITDSMLFPNLSSWKDPPVECLIITPQAYETALEPLAELKKSRGVYTIIVTTEDIYANSTFTATGSDNAAYIRNAIKYYHQNNETEFVILGGDVGLIPIRYAWVLDFDESRFSGDYRDKLKPTDHYYACLGGTWDQDNDGQFGERNVNNANNVDEIDWTPDVFVGRLPFNDVTEANIIVNKIIQYELAPPAGNWFNEAIMGGAVSQFAGGINTNSVDEAELSELIIDNYLTNMEIDRLYYHTTDYTPPSPYTPLTLANLNTSWNQGASILNLAGHGEIESYGGDEGGPFNRYMTANTAKKLTNNGSYPLVYIYSCSSGAYDARELGVFNNSYGDGDCLSEELILNPSGGAIAVVSAIRTTYYLEKDYDMELLNRGQDRYFWREFMMENQYQPGKALYLSQVSYIEQVIDKYVNVELNYDPVIAAQVEQYFLYQEHLRKNILAYNLLGDPEISIYTHVPKNFSTSIIPSSVYSGDLLILNVKADSGEYVPNARILLNNSNYYITAKADEMGVARLPIPRDPSLFGTSMDVTFSGHNMMRFQTSITIINDTVEPASLTVQLPESPLHYLDTLVIEANGVDNDSGIKYAFIVYTDSGGATVDIHEMELVNFEGNVSSFYYKYPDTLPPGETLIFYIIGFDASGNSITKRDAGSNNFEISISSRLIEEMLGYIAIIGAPAAAVLIVLWFYRSGKKRKKVAGVP
ncbi:MAG: C25 family cysteine peptidase [Candidatus Hodarchaeota archaeon]